MKTHSMKNFIKVAFMQNISVLVIVLLFMPLIRMGLVKTDTLFEKTLAVGIIMLLTLLLTTIAGHYYIKWWSGYWKNARL